MYKVIKPERGYTSIVVANPEEGKTVELGVPSINILDILKSGGYEIPHAIDIWDIDIDKETANDLARLTLRMKKPLRTNKKKQVTPTLEASEQTAGETVDAMDVLLGLTKI